METLEIPQKGPLSEKSSALYLPSSVYRLQLNKNFTFKQAEALVPYFKALGIDALYCSPYFEAIPGSLHGYNVTNPHRINPEIGTEKDFESFCETLRSHGMGHILDVVPNHMGIGKQNPWWMDVLEHGPDSAYASFFDINWEPVKKELKGKVLLPILGDLYGVVLENQEIELRYENERFFIQYYDHRLPVASKTYPMILQRAPSDPAQRTAYIEERLRFFKGEKGNPKSFDPLHQLLNAQYYRLAYWRVAAEEINYRRFFNINELAAIRTEDPDVFDHYHRAIFQWIRENKIQGLRIDHPDGLYDPPEYFERLQQSASHPLYVVVEKILGNREPLPENWNIQGTVGYEFIFLQNELFVSREQGEALAEVYEKFIGRSIDFNQSLYEKKKFFALVHLASEVNELGDRLDRISEEHTRFRDYTRNNLTLAIREVIAAFPVYRTYISPREPVSERDRKYIEIAIEKAKSKTPAVDTAVYEFLKKILLLDLDPETPPEQEVQYRDFVLRFQQLTGPVMAKGFEDTSLYIYNRLISLNEVGGNPTVFGISPEEFHRRNLERNKRWPHGFVASSTHDTKRSEDVRMRINVLSEMPVEWKSRIDRWAIWNQTHKTALQDDFMPGKNTEYFIYQTLIGIWPDHFPPEMDFAAFQDRMQEYFLKAAREAGVYTNWMKPNEEYEVALKKFVSGILSPDKENQFLQDFLPFQKKVAAFGLWNALSALILKLGVPGVPDTYQGTELLNYFLVDPDNRRPVNYQQRVDFLNELQAVPESQMQELIQELFRFRWDGRLKLLSLWKGLQFRNQHRDLFAEGDYIPLKVEGDCRQNVVAFLRKRDKEYALVVAGRFFSQILSNDAEALPAGEEVWKNTFLILPEGVPESFTDFLTQQQITVDMHESQKTLPISKIFSNLSAAFLYGHA